MLTCRTYSAAEAVDMGLANMCVDDEAFEVETERLAKQILTQSWFSHRANKRLMDDTDGLRLSAGLAHEIYKNEGRGPDMDARIAEFMSRAKRPT